jgi:hypothetical protein
MKTQQDLFNLLSETVLEDKATGRKRWFFSYSGHVNKLSITYYEFGWGTEERHVDCDVKLTVEGVQEAYWFIKNRLKK